MTNKLAKIISGASLDFIFGFVKGLLQGIWEGLTDPFVLMYHLISGIAKLTNWFYGVVAGDSAMGANTASSTASSTAPSPAAAPSTAAATETQIPPGTQQEITARLAEMGGELAEPAGVVGDNFMGAVTGYFEGGDSMTFEELTEKLGEMWQTAEQAIQGAGTSLAESVVTALMDEGSERKMGEMVGWLAGTIVFEIVLGYFTAGTYTAAKGVGKVLQYFVRFLDWTGEALGIAFKMMGKLGKGVMKLFRKLTEFAAKATGPLRAVLDALKEMGEKIMRYADELMERFGGRAAKEGAEETTEQGAKKAAAETAEETTERTAKEAAEETAEETTEQGAKKAAAETAE
ncbi:MAG: hypothetical protein ACPGU0_09015, partial [Marinirhabdus sp.]